MSNNFRFVNIRWRYWLAIASLFFAGNAFGAGPCHGRFPNPVTDICWECVFPIKIGPLELSSGGQVDNRDSSPPLLCVCPEPPPLFFRIGIGVSLWDPARMAEVVRTPMCSPTLGGVDLGGGAFPAPNGDHSDSEADKSQAFYQIHYFFYPLFSWVGIGLDALCFQSEQFDLAYFTEIDPLWNDDELTMILNPEAILFANVVTQAACAADTISAATTNFGLDSLFWCSGSQGSVFPLSGNHANHIGGVDSSLATVHKHLYRMHRLGIARDTSTTGAMCDPLIQPVMRKNQYKQAMVYPIPQTKNGKGLGVPSILWGAGKEFPYVGEDFSYTIFRKRKCCAL